METWVQPLTLEQRREVLIGSTVLEDRGGSGPVTVCVLNRSVSADWKARNEAVLVTEPWLAWWWLPHLQQVQRARSRPGTLAILESEASQDVALQF